MKEDFIESAIKISTVTFGAYDMYNGQLIYSTGLAEAELGYSPEELKELSKNNFEELIHPEDLKSNIRYYELLEKSAQGEVIEHVLRVRKSDGSYISYFLRDLVFERDDNSRPLKYISLAQDITEVVKLEKDLSEKIQKLKSVALKNAHDVRGPVANIIGLIELMKKESFRTDYHRKIFEHLESTVKTLDEVILEINSMTD